MYTNIINSSLNVRNKVRDMEGNWVDQRKARETLHTRYASPNLSTGEHVAFEEWGKKIIIDQLEYSVDTAHQIFPRLNIVQGSTGRTANNLFIGISDGGTVWDLTVNYLNLGEHSYLELVRYNPTENRFKVVLKRPITLPTGGRLAFIPGSNFDSNTLLYHVSYRIIEE